jgi:hypothetical protein
MARSGRGRVPYLVPSRPLERGLAEQDSPFGSYYGYTGTLRFPNLSTSPNSGRLLGRAGRHKHQNITEIDTKSEETLRCLKVSKRTFFRGNLHSCIDVWR